MDKRGPVLEYSVKSQAEWRGFVLRATCFVALIALLLAALTTTVRVVDSAMDPETGAIMRQTRWLGHRFSPVVIETALDARLTRMGISHTHTWKYFNDTGYNVLGIAMWRGCGQLPAVGRAPLEEFVDKSSDIEIKQFVLTMASGTDAQQRSTRRLNELSARTDRSLPLRDIGFAPSVGRGDKWPDTTGAFQIPKFPLLFCAPGTPVAGAWAPNEGAVYGEHKAEGRRPDRQGRGQDQERGR